MKYSLKQFNKVFLSFKQIYFKVMELSLRFFLYFYKLFCL